MADEPTRQEIWKRFDSHAAAITEVRSGQAATSARLDSLESAVDSGFRTLSSELRNISERVNQPDPAPNYGIYVAIAFGLLGMFGGYALLITNPLHSSIEKNYSQITDLEQHRQRTARLEAQVESLEQQASETREFQKEAQFIHGQREELGKRVDDIDMHGSRRWNENRK